MSSRVPYLQRRGFGLTFRISVPPDLRPLLGCREITQALPVASVHVATPLVLAQAARFKSLFLRLRTQMFSDDPQKQKHVLQMMQQERDKLRLQFQLDEDRQTYETAMEELARKHAQEVEKLRAEADAHRLRAEAFERGLEVGRTMQPVPPVIVPPQVPEKVAPSLSKVIAAFLEDYEKKGRPSMLKEHQLVLPLFLEVIGDKPVDQIKQRDINGFFELLCRLPPRWGGMCKKLGVTPVQLADYDHDETFAQKTFEDKYVASVRFFIETAQTDWQDEGFPATLTTKKIEYRGTRSAGEFKQRALLPQEQARLFEGDELRAFASSPEDVQKFWFPVVGLYTGARVNEVCQINPQCDFRQDSNGIWSLLFSERTPAGKGIQKSIKSDVKKNRLVPIHQHLLELGFVDYLQKLKASGADRLFPMWEPRGDRASPNAERWFIRFLQQIGLHGVENELGRAIRGYHALRFTLISQGKAQNLVLSAISGHARADAQEDDVNLVFEGYVDDEFLNLDLTKKQALVNQLDYGLTLPKPVLPALKAIAPKKASRRRQKAP